MKTVAVKELKNKLSSYLREVRDGEVVLITNRGRVVAELRQPSGALLMTYHRGIGRLHPEGVFAAASPQNPKAYRASSLQHAVQSQDLLDAERGRE